MKHWENIQYQKINQVQVTNEMVSVSFENGDNVILQKNGLVQDTIDVDWDGIDFNSFEIVIPKLEGGEVIIPWDKIRAITDSKFSNYLANKAEEQAESIGLKLKFLRTARNILSKDLAERSGLTPQTITRIEKGKQDVNFKTLQKILAAMGYSLADLAQVSLDESPKTFKKFIQKLQEAGITRNLFFDKLIPREYIPLISTIQEDNPQLLLNEIARSVSVIFGWSSDSIWSDKGLTIDDTSFNQALFKLPSKAKIAQVKAYSVYANYVSSIVLKATPNLQKKKYPESINELREDFFTSFDSIIFENLLRYIWDLGICVVPFFDSGVFHGASWNINGRHIIVIKQNTNSQAKWTFDLLHELYHVLAHLDNEDTTILELEEITPFSGENNEKELEANAFANEFIFNNKEEHYAKSCVNEAKGDIRQLSQATLKVANQYNIRVDFLANYLAYRLQKQGENWWGAASNLQIIDPQPFNTAKRFLQEKIDMENLTAFESSILERVFA